MPVHHVDRALEALAHRERMRGLGKVGVVDDNGVDIVAWDKSAVPAEILVSCAGAEVVALLDGQKFVLSVALHVAELRRADGHGDDLVHGQLRATGDVAAQRDPQSLVDHLPHGTQAGADVHVGICAVYHHHTGIADGRPFPLVGVDAVGHHRAAVPETVFGVGLPVLLTVRVQLLYPLHLVGIFGKVGLYRDIRILSSYFPKLLH